LGFERHSLPVAVAQLVLVRSIPRVSDNNLQAQKDKCTTEQFWFTATILAVNAFLLTAHLDLTGRWPVVIRIHSAVISLYASWLVLDRARRYRELDTGTRKLRWSDLKGAGLYLYLILSSCAAVVFMWHPQT
jgi:hypothetical protein